MCLEVSILAGELEPDQLIWVILGQCWCWALFFPALAPIETHKDTHILTFLLPLDMIHVNKANATNQYFSPSFQYFLTKVHNGLEMLVVQNCVTKKLPT